LIIWWDTVGTWIGCPLVQTNKDMPRETPSSWNARIVLLILP
jgi:hypothetical protein